MNARNSVHPWMTSSKASWLYATSHQFNLRPYRHNATRRARQRCLLECLCAALAGCVVVVAWTAWQTHENARLDAQRETLQAALIPLNTQLAEYRQLEKQRALQRQREARTRQLAALPARLLDLLITLGNEPSNGVLLHRLTQLAHGVELRAFADDSAASVQWLTRLQHGPDVRTIEVTKLRQMHTSPQVMELTAKLLWNDVIEQSARQGQDE